MKESSDKILEAELYYQTIKDKKYRTIDKYRKHKYIIGNLFFICITAS